MAADKVYLLRTGGLSRQIVPFGVYSTPEKAKAEAEKVFLNVMGHLPDEPPRWREAITQDGHSVISYIWENALRDHGSLVIYGFEMDAPTRAINFNA